MKTKKASKPPYRSVKKLQFYFDNLMYDDSYPMGDYIELGSDGIYRTHNNH